ncbi:FtsW/RodA/SpoVE family cell cycle protein [uncultured Alistipes sp.]|uniref:FtsW/RodA/SpoVE family cell cycle protein n=1 Tax=uncultured Alistipes sp. TaxID=538949 RepID=UPI0026057E6C|nr:FtsW/RodA/SpoVE family cell cycle protein [uncultured Alistipes sp.]
MPEPCPWEETSGPVADVAARGARAGDTAGGSARSGSHAAERDASEAGAHRAGASGDAEAPKQPQEEAGATPFRVFTGDRVLWIIVAALAVISILVVYSSTAKMAYDAHTVRSTSHFLRQQIMILVVSLGIMLVVHKIDCRIYNHLSKPAYLIGVLLTIAVYFIGATTNGAARWIPLGPFQFQPSEALKVATVLFLARQLAGRQSKIDKLCIVPSWRFWTWWSDPAQGRIWREGTWPVLMPVVVSCAVIFPAHTSSAVLVFAASWVMMLIGRVRFGELLKLVAWAVAGVVLIMALNLGRSETAEGRVATWIHLWTQSQTDKPIDHLTDTERSMIAIHNGGILGEGAGQSAMRVEMIHPESDYAYAFFVEEYGLILAVALLMLYLWIFFRAIEIFRRCGTAFPGLLVLGLALLITCQALLHIMVTVNLIPETGQTLPLISRGGSSVLFTAMALGMILSVSRQNDEHSHDRPRAETLYER